MTTRKNVDVYLDTIDRMEPDIALVDAGAFYASAAISLKRIADSVENMNAILHEIELNTRRYST